MPHDDELKARLSSNKYLAMAENMRLLASRAGSEETCREFDRLATLYERLANRAARGLYNEPDAPLFFGTRASAACRCKRPISTTIWQASPLTDRACRVRTPCGTGMFGSTSA